MVKHLVVGRQNVLLALGGLDVISLYLEVFIWQRQHNGIMESSDALGFTEVLRLRRQRMAALRMLDYCGASIFEFDSFGRRFPRKINSFKTMGELLAFLLEVFKI